MSCNQDTTLPSGPPHISLSYKGGSQGARPEPLNSGPNAVLACTLSNFQPLVGLIRLN